MIRLFKILFLLFFVSCASIKPEKLQQNPTIRFVFNTSETQDLQKLLDFFENSICKSETIEKENISICYNKFLERIKKESELDGNVYLKIPIDKQLKVYRKLSAATFKEIWQLGKSFPLKTRTDTLKYFSYKIDGKYVNFLEELGKSYKVIDNYRESFLNAGDMTPSMWASVLMEHKEYNTKDIRIRLFIAIHYLTRNDNNLRKEKYE